MARAHKDDQVRQAAIIEAALSELWDRIIDPSDLTRSFLRFREEAAVIILDGRAIAERDADAYYRKLAAFKGTPTALTGAPRASRARGPVKASLSGAVGRSLARAAYLDSKGTGNASALAAAKSMMLGSAKRQIINASRQRLQAVSRADSRIRGWARESDGNPCGFCAMLVGRGPVYADDTVGFQAHDRCGCNVRLVYWDDDDRGWSDEALAYREAYEQGVIGITQGTRRSSRTGAVNNIVGARWEAGFDAAAWLKWWLSQPRNR